MKRFFQIPVLLFLAGLWGGGIFLAQLMSLPQIREQVASGLRVGLNEIARGIALDLSQSYEADLRHAFQQKDFPPRLAASQWIAVPDSHARRWQLHPAPMRSASQPDAPTSETSYLSTQLGLLYDHWGADAPLFWDNLVDSTFLFYYQANPLARTQHYAFCPQFDERGQMTHWQGLQLQEEYLRGLMEQYFEHRFWPEDSVRSDGIHKDFLDIRITDEKGERLFQSVLLVGGKMEARVPLRQFGNYLELWTVEVGFWGKDSAGVAASLHRRNLWLVSGAFGVWSLLLMLAYFSWRRNQRLSRLKTEFLANITHELKTPLTSIRLASDTLRLGRTQSPEEARRSAELIHQESLRLDKLWSTLLDYARQESGKRPYQLEKLALADWWETWTHRLAQQVNLRGFELERNGSPQGFVQVDRSALHETLQILLDNAMQYSGEARRLSVSCAQQDTHWQLHIRDFGIGIAPADQKVIFERFVRLGNLETHDVKGYGIGLSIAKAHLEAMQGQIEVASTPGEGSCFTLILPWYES